MERCKHRKESTQNQDSVIQCICSQNTEEHGTMVQCDKCRIWVHSECVGLSEDKLDDVFYCHSCKDTPQQQHDSQSQQQDLLQILLDTQLREESSQEQQQQQQYLSSQPISDDDYSSMSGNMMIEEDDQNSSISHAMPGSTQLHVWDDFSFADVSNNNEPWSALDDEEPFSDIPSSWTMSDINLFDQTPSLLFSDTSLPSALDDELNSTTALVDQNTIEPLPMTPLNESTPNESIVSNTPIHTTTDGLWFQFANFDDDYCED